MPRTRPPYAPEFRQEAVRLLRSGARSTKQLAAELGCSPQTLSARTRPTAVSARTCSVPRSGSGCASSNAKIRCCVRSGRS